MKKYKYYARQGAPFKNDDAQEIGRFINNIKKKTTKNILKKIEKTPDHVIHDYIEWDDTVAGEKYRLQQVRNIVNHVDVKIIDNGSHEPVRAFYSVVEDSGKTNEKSYVQVDVAFDDDDKKSQIISRAKHELKNWRDRYKVYRELQDVVSVIEPFIT